MVKRLELFQAQLARHYRLTRQGLRAIALGVLTVSCGPVPIASELPPGASPQPPSQELPSASLPEISGAVKPTPLAELLSESDLWTRLQEGRNQIYGVLTRHAIAPGTGDPANFVLEDCTTQRNLSEAGREQAIQMGAAFRQRNIPVQAVLSSQWCRCLETARLMDLGPVMPFPALNSFFRDRRQAEPQTNQLLTFLRQQTQPGVYVLVTHQVNITAVSNIFPQSGEAVVLAVGSDQSLTVLGRMIL